MKKISIGIMTLFIMLSLTGCGASYYEGQPKPLYNPTSIDGASENKGALIKVANGLIIWKVDGERKVNFVKAMFGKGLDSIIVKEGIHTLSCSKGMDVNIGAIKYKSGHEYFIDYLEVKDGSRRSIHYWVIDITDNKIVYGKEKRKKDFEK